MHILAQPGVFVSHSRSDPPKALPTMENNRRSLHTGFFIENFPESKKAKPFPKR